MSNELTIKLIWNDNNNKEKLRPSEVTAILSNDDTVTLTSANNWTGTISDLPQGEYSWTVVVLGYVTDNTITDDNTTIVTLKLWERPPRTIEKKKPKNK